MAWAEALQEYLPTRVIIGYKASLPIGGHGSVLAYGKTRPEAILDGLEALQKLEASRIAAQEHERRVGEEIYSVA